MISHWLITYILNSKSIYTFNVNSYLSGAPLPIPCIWYCSKVMSHSLTNYLLISRMLTTLNLPPSSECLLVYRGLNHSNRCLQKITQQFTRVSYITQTVLTNTIVLKTNTKTITQQGSASVSANLRMFNNYAMLRLQECHLCINKYTLVSS